MELGGRTETREVMLKEAGKAPLRQCSLMLDVEGEVASPGRGNDIRNVALEQFLCY